MYAAYLRKSRPNADDPEDTLEAHRKIITEAAERQNIRISRWYEEVVSGDTIEARPEVQKLLREVRQGIYKGVFVTEISRLARGKTKDQGEIAEAFASTHTLIYTPQRTYNPADDMDETFFDFELFMARQEFKYIKKRLRAGRELSRSQGQHMGIAPLGYTKIDKVLTPDANAPIVKAVFEHFVSTMNVRDTTKWLMAKGIMMSYVGVRHLLENPVYMGFQPRNKDGTLSKGAWTPIISEDLFQRTQEILTFLQPRTAVRKKLANPLASLLRCKKCGRALVLRINALGSGYLCHNTTLTNPCLCSSVHLDIAMNELLDALEAGLPQLSIESEPRKKDLDALKKQVRNAEAAISRINEAYEAGVYSLEETKTRKEAQLRAIEKLRAEINAPERRKRITTTKDMIDGMRDYEKDPKLVNMTLKELIERIDYTREKRTDEPVFEVHFRQ